MRFVVLVLPIVASFTFVSSGIADEPAKIRLWERRPSPGSPATKPDDEPELFVKRPSGAANGTAVIVLPGGGYSGLAMTYEGLDVGDWFDSFGVTAFVLKYRLRGTGHMHPIPMMDGQRAIRTVRGSRRRVGLDLCASACWVSPPAGTSRVPLPLISTTAVDNGRIPSNVLSSRPDFLILCYPVISLVAPYAHHGSVDNLLGESPDPNLLYSLSNETQVTPNTPPTFIFHTSEDSGVPAENAVAFYLALHKAGVPARNAHLRKGQHGVGLAKDIPGTKQWPNLCRNGWTGRWSCAKPMSRRTDVGQIHKKGLAFRRASAVKVAMGTTRELHARMR